MSDFESAADAVKKQTEDPGYVDVIYDVRKYPPCPIGIYDAICCKAEQKDANPNGEFYKPGDKRIHLSWEIVSPTYKDEQGEERHYRVFSRPLSTSYGAKANLAKLWENLTGSNVQDFLKKEPGVVNIGAGKTKAVTRIRFEHKMFENMRAKLNIDHQEWPEGSGEMKPNIVSYKVSPEMKQQNYRQLPGMSRATPLAQTEAQADDGQSAADIAAEMFKPAPTAQASAVHGAPTPQTTNPNAPGYYPKGWDIK